MIHTILEKKQFSKDVFYLRVAAPEIARQRKAGQFVIIQLDIDYGERIPLTIADADPAAGWIALVVRRSGQPLSSSVKRKQAIRLPQFSGRSAIRHILQRSERSYASAAVSVRLPYTRLPKPISVPVMRLSLSSAGAQKNSLFSRKKCAK